MSRKHKVLEKARETVEEGQKPSALQLSRTLEWPEQDVHRCLNSLERKGVIETYSRELMGRRHRFVGLKR